MCQVCGFGPQDRPSRRCSVLAFSCALLPCCVEWSPRDSFRLTKLYTAIDTARRVSSIPVEPCPFTSSSTSVMSALWLRGRSRRKNGLCTRMVHALHAGRWNVCTESNMIVCTGERQRFRVERWSVLPTALCFLFALQSLGSVDLDVCAPEDRNIAALHRSVVSTSWYHPPSQSLACSHQMLGNPDCRASRDELDDPLTLHQRRPTAARVARAAINNITTLRLVRPRRFWK